MGCLSQLYLLCHNGMAWGAYTWQAFISHSSGDWRYKVKSVGQVLLRDVPRFTDTVLLLDPHMVGREATTSAISLPYGHESHSEGSIL